MKINEIFYSLQGEGFYTGTPAVFVRTSGCNLRCPFCDTQHQTGTDMSIGEIVDNVTQYPTPHIVITGGEPTLQPDLAELVDALHDAQRYVQIETNGTNPVPANIDWVTCSPKELDRTKLTHISELKVLYTGAGMDMTPYEDEGLFHAKRYSLQPLDTNDPARNQQIISDTVEYILDHPKWHLSLQTHKLIDIK